MKNSIIFITMIFAAGFLMFSCNPSKKETVPEIAENLLSNPETKASCVFMTTDESGLPMISWVEEKEGAAPRMFFAVWQSDQNKFGNKKEIPIPENTSIHEEGMPKIAFKSDGTMLATYESSVSFPTKKWGISDLSYMESKDRGQSWTKAQSVYKNKHANSSSNFSGLNRLADGEIGIAWLDNNPDSTVKSRPLMFAKSLKEGGFGNAVQVTSQTCECCRIAVAGNNKNEVVLAFRNLTPEKVRDIALSVSTDNGAHFSEATDFSNEQWIVDGCPHKGPALAVNGEKKYISWFTGLEGREGIYFGVLDENEKTTQKSLLSADGEFTRIAITKDGTPLIVYSEYYEKEEKTYMRIMLAKPTGSDFLKIQVSDTGRDANHPVIQVLNDNGILIGWSENGRAVYKKISLNDID